MNEQTNFLKYSNEKIEPNEQTTKPKARKVIENTTEEFTCLIRAY